MPVPSSKNWPSWCPGVLHPGPWARIDAAPSRPAVRSALKSGFQSCFRSRSMPNVNMASPYRRAFAANQPGLCYFFSHMTLPEQSNDKHPSRAAVSDTERASLDAWPNAALLFDPKSASLVAANSEGQAWFPGLPTALDGAMPAVRTLREIARKQSDGVQAIPLVFWTAKGLQALACDVARVERSNEEPLLMVRALSAGQRLNPAPQHPVPPQHRNDEDTLRDIASKIRDGQKRFNTPSTRSTQPPEEQLQTQVSTSPAPSIDIMSGIDLAKLAHELKTPVSAIAAASEIMKEGRFGPIENERYAAYIDGIHASARHAIDLIERMLDRRNEPTVSRPPSLQFETIDLDEFISTAVATLQPLASAKGLSLISEAAATKATVKADRTTLKQIVLNLLTNAIKFTPSGGTITVAIVGSRRGAAAFTVEDSGPGMTAVAIAEALRPVPLDVPNVRDGGGLGLGLPLSRALAEANGAALSIDSAPGRGTRVTVSFPGGPLVAI